MDDLRVLALMLLVAVTRAVDETCQLTITVDAQQIQGICQSHGGPPLGIIQPELQKLKDDNAQLQKDLEEMKAEYSSMVDTVKQLHQETESWRQIIEWPQIDPVFKPDNETLYIDPDGPKYKDCQAAVARTGKQGIYTLKPGSSEKDTTFQAYCDEEGWTIIQRRFDGSENFYRSWDDYMSGFGRLGGEVWLGLENVHLLTSRGDEYVLRVEALGYNKKLYYSENPGFSIKSELDEYEIVVGNKTEGNYKDLVAELSGTPFTTKDNDNDEWWDDNCAYQYRGAFWLKNCGWDLNREYCEGHGCMSFDDRSIKKSIIKMRGIRAGAAPRRESLPAPSPDQPKPRRQKKPKRTRAGRNNG